MTPPHRLRGTALGESAKGRNLSTGDSSPLLLGSLPRLVGEPSDDGLHVLVTQHVFDEARHLAVGPVAHPLGAAQELAEGLGLEIVDRVHRLAEIGPLFALAGTLEAVAGDA